MNLKRDALEYLAETGDPRATAKIRAVAQSDADMNVRRAAIEYLGQTAGSFEDLVALFDATQEPQLKRDLLEALAQLDDPRVTGKLFSIAQSDPDRQLRRDAVEYLADR